jgi:transcriptional regulator with GAF, ATPase, and Fis domain
MKTATTAALSDIALRVQELAHGVWGDSKTVDMVGISKPYTDLLGKLDKIAFFNEPVLVTGESGSGKEAIAQAIYLLGPRRGRPMVSVNCPQYMEGNLTVSELFGHRRGSFTGASADRKGCFETADGGVIFLDEIGDLHMSAQVMLLRALANGEFQPLGADTPKRVNVRVVCATNRPLEKLVLGKEFRHDLYFRLRYFLIKVPPLRERGEDWFHLAQHVLGNLHQKYGVEKQLSTAALKLLENYTWPGNVRELISVTTMGYALCDGDVIEPRDFVSYLATEAETHVDESRGLETHDDIYQRVVAKGESFWDAVYTPFMDRDLNRAQVRTFMKKVLVECDGSYRRALDLVRIPPDEYQRLMDFLRHQRLKP